VTWTELVDGESLDGWHVAGDESAWGVEDGGLYCCGGDGGYLYTDERYDDFEVTLSFRMTPGANSGVFLRLSDLADPVNTGLEVQILDTHGTEDPDSHDCGALYDVVAPEADAARPPGEWNDLRVTCDGPHVAVELNGETTVEADLDRWDTPGENPDGTANKFEYAWADLPYSGHLALQDHGDEVWFRDLRLRDL
jgi:hypothetical protein